MLDQDPDITPDTVKTRLMLTAKHFDEMMLYRVAHAFELTGDWQNVGATG